MVRSDLEQSLLKSVVVLGMQADGGTEMRVVVVAGESVVATAWRAKVGDVNRCKRIATHSRFASMTEPGL